MRRLTLLLALLPALSFAQARSWEKLVGPGLTYRMEFDAAAPQVIHGLRWSPKAATFHAKPELAKGTVYPKEEGANGREALPDMLQRTGAVAGVNADFFPWTGDPLGVMISDGELVSIPYKGRSAIAWGENYSAFGQMEFSGKIVAAGGKEVVLSGVNQEANGNMAVFNGPAAGRALSKQPALHVVLLMPTSLPANGAVKARIERFEKDATSVQIEPGQAVLTLCGTTAAAFRDLPTNVEVEIRTQLRGVDTERAKFAVGGGPMLLRNSQIVVKAGDEEFDAAFVNQRHPRTAIGRTADGDIWLVTVDGRMPNVSRGMTLPELGKLMQRLGCVDALNLDGGGSTTLGINGLLVNRPSEVRTIANGVLLFGETPFQVIPEVPESPTMVIVGRPKMTLGLFSQFQVVDVNGVMVPNSEVIWAASGAGWVDQGGYLRGMQAGEVTLRAAVRGRILEVKVTVEAPVQTPPPGS